MLVLLYVVFLFFVALVGSLLLAVALIAFAESISLLVERYQRFRHLFILTAIVAVRMWLIATVFR